MYYLKYSIPKEIPVAFHNRSNNDYCFIIKELAKEFEEKCNCLRANIEKYNTFSILIIKKVKRIDKN